MKYFYTKISIAASILLSSYGSFSQKLLWTSENGGTNQNGAIIGYDLQTQQTETIASLGGNFQGTFEVLLNQNVLNDRYFNTEGMVKGSDGMYYGVNSLSRQRLSEGTGAFYRIDPATNEFELLHTFSSNGKYNLGAESGNYSSFGNELAVPALGIIEAEPGVFYGIAVKGGEHEQGGVWRFDVNGDGYSKVGYYDTLSTGGVGRTPNSPLIKGPNGDLYGVLINKGEVGNANTAGHLYKVNLSGQNLEYVSSLVGDVAGWAISGPVCQIVYNSNLNKIFGTKETFSGGVYGGGVYNYDFNTGHVKNETFIRNDQVTTLGSNCHGIVEGNDGNYYVMTKNGGTQGHGTILRYIPGNQSMSKVADFPESSPSGTNLIAVGSKIYGTYAIVLESNKNMMWSLDVDQPLLGVESFLLGTDDNTLGYFMAQSFIADGNDIIGRTSWGGDGNAGMHFKYNGSTVSVIQKHASPEGRGLRGELTVTGEQEVIAFTHSGGTIIPGEYSEHGGLVRINLATGEALYDSGLSEHFEAKNVNYNTELKSVVTQNGNIFTMTRVNKGVDYYNKLIKYDASAGTSTTIKIFNSNQDATIGSPLEYADNKVVIASQDSIYLYNDNDGTFTNTNVTFDTDQNGNFSNNLMQASNGKLYGVTHIPLFSSPAGTKIIEIDTTNWSVDVIHAFDSTVKETNIGLVEYDGKLWGNTLNGGPNGKGYIFSINFSGTGGVVHEFDNQYDFIYPIDGGGFMGEWLVHEDRFYTVSFTGGAHGYGTLVTFNPNNPILTVLEDLTLENGRAYKATPIVWTPSTTGIFSSASSNEVAFYPNPTTESITVDMKNTQSIKVYNTLGQELKVDVLNNVVNTSSLEPGMYIIKVTDSSNKEYQSTFVKK